jgi:hypothetical protein
MALLRLTFETGEELSSYFFVVENGWPVVGPFATLAPAGAAQSWIRGLPVEVSTGRALPEPTVHDTARCRDRWGDALAGAVRFKLHIGRVRARRWVRGRQVCDGLSSLDASWRTAIELALRPASRTAVDVVRPVEGGSSPHAEGDQRLTSAGG